MINLFSGSRLPLATLSNKVDHMSFSFVCPLSGFCLVGEENDLGRPFTAAIMYIMQIKEMLLIS